MLREREIWTRSLNRLVVTKRLTYILDFSRVIMKINNDQSGLVSWISRFSVFWARSTSKLHVSLWRFNLNLSVYWEAVGLNHSGSLDYAEFSNLWQDIRGSWGCVLPNCALSAVGTGWKSKKRFYVLLGVNITKLIITHWRILSYGQIRLQQGQFSKY